MKLSFNSFYSKVLKEKNENGKSINGTIVKERTKGEILEIKKYKEFKGNGVKFEDYQDIYVLEQD